jgi:hypothetical protein
MKLDWLWNRTDTDEYYDTTDTSLKMLNPNDDEFACDLDLEIGTFPGRLDIICEDENCPIVQKDDELRLGEFRVYRTTDGDGYSDIYLKKLVADKVYFNVAGTVAI